MPLSPSIKLSLVFPFDERSVGNQKCGIPVFGAGYYRFHKKKDAISAKTKKKQLFTLHSVKLSFPIKADFGRDFFFLSLLFFHPPADREK